MFSFSMIDCGPALFLTLFVGRPALLTLTLFLLDPAPGLLYKNQKFKVKFPWLSTLVITQPKYSSYEWELEG